VRTVGTSMSDAQRRQQDQPVHDAYSDWTHSGMTTAGAKLRARREALGVPIEAIMRKTRMPRRTIERLEADDFEAIGAEFYVRGFLRLYAEHLGMPIDPLIETYETQIAIAPSRTEPTGADVPSYFQTRSEPARSMSPAQVFLLLICAATLVAFMFSVQKQRKTRSVAQRPGISAPGTPATAHRPMPALERGERFRAADAVGN